jgi:hypothetical protein
MTTLALPRPSAGVRDGAGDRRAALLVAGLALAAVARWSAWRADALHPILLGALFGAALLGLAAAGGWRVRRWRSAADAARAVALGVAGGAVLAATALVGPHPSWAPILAGSFPFWPWAAATVLVAAAEEALLRGALFDELLARHGVLVAVAATSLVFALLHVPVYGWSAVPLDLGVGLLLGGLRLVSGGVAAPAIAHALADLAVVTL